MYVRGLVAARECALRSLARRSAFDPRLTPATLPRKGGMDWTSRSWDCDPRTDPPRGQGGQDPGVSHQRGIPLSSGRRASGPEQQCPFAQIGHHGLPLTIKVCPRRHNKNMDSRLHSPFTPHSLPIHSPFTPTTDATRQYRILNWHDFAAIPPTLPLGDSAIGLPVCAWRTRLRRVKNYVFNGVHQCLIREQCDFCWRRPGRPSPRRPRPARPFRQGTLELAIPSPDPQYTGFGHGLSVSGSEVAIWRVRRVEATDVVSPLRPARRKPACDVSFGHLLGRLRRGSGHDATESLPGGRSFERRGKGLRDRDH